MRAQDSLLRGLLCLGFAALALSLGVQLHNEAVQASLIASSWCGSARIHDGAFLLFGHCLACVPTLTAFAGALAAFGWAASKVWPRGVAINQCGARGDRIA